MKDFLMMFLIVGSIQDGCLPEVACACFREDNPSRVSLQSGFEEANRDALSAKPRDTRRWWFRMMLIFVLQPLPANSNPLVGKSYTLLSTYQLGSSKDQTHKLPMQGAQVCAVRRVSFPLPQLIGFLEESIWKSSCEAEFRSIFKAL